MTARRRISLSDFHFANHLSGHEVMGTLKGYFDESGKENDPGFKDFACSVAGYIGTVDAWCAIELEWGSVLKNFDVPYLHMKEYTHSIINSPFESWKGNEEKRADFLKQLIEKLKDKGLLAIGAIVRLPDVWRFNRDFSINVEAYPLGIYASMIHTTLAHPNDTVEFVLDRVDNHYSKVAAARRYADGDGFYKDCGKNIEILPLANVSSKQCIPLQVADLLAYEVLKSHRWKNDFHAASTWGTRNPVDYFHDLSLWRFIKDGDGIFPPRERKSFEALARTTPIEGFVWDYDLILSAHKTRTSLW